MVRLVYDHVHVRNPVIQGASDFYETVFGVGRVAEHLSASPPWIEMSIEGTRILISMAEAGAVNPAPLTPCFGLDHFGFFVIGIDAIVDEMKQKGVAFTMDPTTIRPGVRIAFLRGPDGVSIELIERGVD